MNINLLPVDLRPKGTRIPFLVMVALCGITVVFAAGDVFYMSDLSTSKHALTVGQHQFEQLITTDATVRRQLPASTSSNVDNGVALKAQILALTTASTGIIDNHVNYTATNGYIINGIAESLPALAAYEDAISAMKGISIVDVQQAGLTNGHGYSFSMKIGLAGMTGGR